MKSTLLYEGKAKKVYYTKGDSGQLVLEYKDEATAFNGKKKESFQGKGRLNNLISAAVFKYLQEHGIRTHFIEKLSENEQIVDQTEIIPLEVVVRNVATGSITKRLAFQEGTSFSKPLIELFYKDDALDDPLINDEHALLLTTLTSSELAGIKEDALKINLVLKELFEKVDLNLIDFKLEFGRKGNEIVLADEVSPDTCRLWDKRTNSKMDKDVFRQGTGDLIEVYEQILSRLEER